MILKSLNLLDSWVVNEGWERGFDKCESQPRGTSARLLVRMYFFSSKLTVKTVRKLFLLPETMRKD